MTPSHESGNWLVNLASNGYPEEIALVLSEEELVELQAAVGDSNIPLRQKLRAIQMAAFAAAHG